MKHVIIQLITLIEHQKWIFHLYDALDGQVQYFTDTHPASLKTEFTGDLPNKITFPHILITKDDEHLMILLCVHGGCRCFATSRTTHDPADFFKFLRIAQGIPYLLKGVRFHELPTGGRSCRGYLRDDIAEHIITDTLILAVNHGTQCPGRYAVQTCRSLFLAGILCCIYPESFTDTVFLLLCHCTVHFI